MSIVTTRRLNSYHRQVVAPMLEAFPHEVEHMDMVTGEVSFLLADDDGTLITDDDGTELSVSKYIAFK